ncbi:MAG: YHYH protein [Cyclobacteriaceae bacterium]
MRNTKSIQSFPLILSLLILAGCATDEDPSSENITPVVANALQDITRTTGFGIVTVEMGAVFSDQDEDVLTISATSSDENVALASVSGETLTLTEVGEGSTTITVTANDGNDGSVSDEFVLTILPGSNSSSDVTITFGTNTGNSVELSNWTTLTAVDGYIVVVSDAEGISDRIDGDEPLNSTRYVGTGEQVIYKGAGSSSLEITLLEDASTYYFKVFPYSGNFVYDNAQLEQQTTTMSCTTISTTVSNVCFEVSGDLRVISSNQYPSHVVGNFPNADPTAIEVTRSLDLTPELAGTTTYVFNETSGPTPMNPNFYQFGIATNGVEFHPMGLKPWTNPDDAEENWEWQEQVTQEGQTDLDAYGAHVTSQGNYHYHGDIVALAADEDGSRHSLLYGFAGDGFPIYYKYGYTDKDDPTSAIKELKSSHRLKSGSRTGTGTGTAGKDYPDGTHDGTYIQDYEYVTDLGDLDECNGRSGVTPEFPDGTYYYVITSDFPVTPNCFKGTPDVDWQIGK